MIRLRLHNILLCSVSTSPLTRYHHAHEILSLTIVFSHFVKSKRAELHATRSNILFKSVV